MSNKNLKKQAVNGVKWTSLFSLINALLGIVYKIVLVWLLLPEDYAYIAVISFFIGLSDLVNNLGLGEAILQKDNVTNNQLSSILYFNTIISFFLACILFYCSPLIEKYYAYENLSPILQLTSITVLLNGFSSLFRVKLQKELNFKSFIVISLIRLVIDMIITIVLIALGFGIWGYAYGTVISTAFFTIQLVYYSLKNTDMKVKLHFNIKDIVPFLKFGASISFKQIFAFSAQRIDELIIGRYLAPEVLGIYFFAKDFVKKPQTLITQAFSQVMLPVFSKLKNDYNQLSRVYNNASKYISLIAFPIFTGLAVTAQLYVPVFFGEEWSESVPAIRIFSITALLLVLTANFSTSLLYAINKPNTVLKIEILTNSFYFIALYFFANDGVMAILVTYLVYTLIKTLTLQVMVSKNLDYSLITYFNSLKYVIVFSMIMGVLVILSIFMLQSLNIVYQLVFSCLIGAGIYMLLVLIFEKQTLKKIIDLVK